MAKIISYKECEAKCKGSELCPYCGECEEATTEKCLKCKHHCPCCVGHRDGFCNQCSEEDCYNRNKPYDPNAISKEE